MVDSTRFVLKKLLGVIYLAVVILITVVCAAILMAIGIPPQFGIILFPLIAIWVGIMCIRFVVYFMVAAEILRLIIIYPFRGYFKSNKFLDLKYSVQKSIDEYNELWEYVMRYERQYATNRVLLGSSDKFESLKHLDDDNYRRLSKGYFTRVRYCSEYGMRLAHGNSFIALCKYFDISKNAQTLAALEDAYLAINTAVEGVRLLHLKREAIFKEIEERIPRFYKSVAYPELMAFLELSKYNGFDWRWHTFKFNLDDVSIHDIEMDPETLQNFIAAMADFLHRAEEIDKSREVISSYLIDSVKDRDNNTCHICGASGERDESLLLQVEYDDPENKEPLNAAKLRTVCWRCKKNNVTSV